MTWFTNIDTSTSRAIGRSMGGLLLLALTVFVASSLPLVYFTNLPRWYDVATGSVYAPRVYLLALLACGPFLLLDRTRVLAFAREPYVLWCGALFAIHLLIIARLEIFGGTLSDRESIGDFARKFVLAPAFAYLVWSIDTSWFVRFIKALCIVAPVVVIFDFLNPGVMYDESVLKGATAGRAGGPWFNPNLASEGLLLALVLGHAYFDRIASVVVYILIGIAAVLTGSRAGIVGWLVLGALLVHRRSLPKIMLLTPVVLAVFYGSFFIFVEDLVRSIPEHRDGVDNFLARLDFVGGKVDVEEGGGGGRFELAANALRANMEHALLGYGYPYEDDLVEIGAGPHNLPLQLWHMYGLAGLVLWGTLGWLLAMRTGTRSIADPALFVYLWFSFFNHNIFENNHWYVFFALTFFVAVKSPRVSGGGLRGMARDLDFSRPDLPVRARSGRRRRRSSRTASW